MENINHRDEYIKIEDIIKHANNIEHDNKYSNFTDVINEDNKNNTNMDNKKLYQMQFKNQVITNEGQLTVVGVSEKCQFVKITDLTIFKNKWMIVAHVFKNTDTNNNFYDLISLVLNKENKKKIDIVISFRYIIKTTIIKNNCNYYYGDFAIVFKYRNNDKHELFKLCDIHKYPGDNKIIELLIKELSNPNIIDKIELLYE